MAPEIAVIMVVGTGVLFAGAWWLVEAVAPRKMAERTSRQIMLHTEAVEALRIAVSNPAIDAAQKARLAASLEWHLAALTALSPAAATAASTELPLAA